MNQVKNFKSCLSQILLGPFLNTLTNSLFILCIINNNYGGESFDNTFFELQSSLKTNFRQWKPVKLKGFWHLLIKRRETHVENKKNGTRNKFCQTGMMLSKTAWIRSLCVCGMGGRGEGGVFKLCIQDTNTTLQEGFQTLLLTSN